MVSRRSEMKPTTTPPTPNTRNKFVNISIYVCTKTVWIVLGRLNTLVSNVETRVCCVWTWDKGGYKDRQATETRRSLWVGALGER